MRASTASAKRSEHTKKHAPKTSPALGYRDAQQSRLAARALEGATLDADHLLTSIYSDVSKSSFHKTFSRDRADLEDAGIVLKETKHGRTKTWKLDRHTTLACASEISDEDARVVAELARAALAVPTNIKAHELGCAIARIGRGIAGSTPNIHRKLPCKPKIIERLTEALGQRRPCSMLYTSRAQSSPSPRRFCPWGFFEQEGALYVVGEREHKGVAEVRTYNLARADKVEILHDEDSYTIPDTFTISDYRFLPFEFGDDAPCSIQLYVRPKDAPLFLEKMRKRGSIETQADGSRIWQGYARSIERAARWAIEVAAIPISPPELKSTWTHMLTNAHTQAQTDDVQSATATREAPHPVDTVTAERGDGCV